VTAILEALITHELMQTAGTSEEEQLKRGVIPIELKFERYRPGTRGDLAYLLSDDEKYDAAFPHHPLTRVRRWLRHIERTFRVGPVEEPPAQPAAKPGLFGKLRGRFGAEAPDTLNLKSDPAPPGKRFEIELVAPKPMSLRGDRSRVRPPGGGRCCNGRGDQKSQQRTEPADGFPPLETRQKMFPDRRDAELRKVADHFQAQQKKLQSVRGAAAKFLQESRAEEITVLLARARGHWLTVQEGSARAQAIFQNTAFYDDFTEAKDGPVNPSALQSRNYSPASGNFRARASIH
jgi:hypothetical protein